jgi:hypothetical protein
MRYQGDQGATRTAGRYQDGAGRYQDGRALPGRQGATRTSNLHYYPLNLAASFGKVSAAPSPAAATFAACSTSLLRCDFIIGIGHCSP